MIVQVFKARAAVSASADHFINGSPAPEEQQRTKGRGTFPPDGSKDTRVNHDLTQEALATKLGVGLRTMNHWERGWTKPTLSLLPKLKFLLSEACSMG
jgi:DNA-binding XRE family transcriptional regulator